MTKQPRSELTAYELDEIRYGSGERANKIRTLVFEGPANLTVEEVRIMACKIFDEFNLDLDTPVTSERFVKRFLQIDWERTEAAARRMAEQATEVVELMKEALKPLAAIADAYDKNELDDGAQRFWGDYNEKSTPHDETELYSGRGGKRLLTLADCFAAREALATLAGKTP